MTRVTTLDMLTAARRDGYGIPAFNVIGIEHAEGIVSGAESANAPVILQVSANAVKYHGGSIAPIGRACAEIANAANVPVALHLDHATTRTLCEEAVACGFSSVMLDTSDLPFSDNLSQTAELVRWAHDRGVAVEAGLGTVGGKDGAVTTRAGMTDPEAARSFVAETGANSLAVAIGTTHGMAIRTATLNVDLLAEIRAAVDVPLVLHGSSGVPDEGLAAAVAGGITKINLATQLNQAFTGAIRRYLVNDAIVSDPRKYLTEARSAVADIVADRLRLLGAAGRG